MSALTTAAAQLPPPPEPPEAPETVGKGKRPTTRAGRAAAAAQRKGEPKADRKPASSSRPKVKTDIAGSVDGLHTLAGMAVLPMVGLPQTGAALAECGEAAGAAWAEAAQRYPWIEKAFGTGQDGLVLFKLLMIYAPLVTVAMAEKSGQLPPAGGADPMAGLAAMMGGAMPMPTAPDAPGVPNGQNANGRP